MGIILATWKHLYNMLFCCFQLTWSRFLWCVTGLSGSKNRPRGWVCMWAHVSYSACFFSELKSSICVLGVCGAWGHGRINSGACECWTFRQLYMSLFAPLQPLHSWGTTHSTPNLSLTALQCETYAQDLPLLLLATIYNAEGRRPSSIRLEVSLQLFCTVLLFPELTLQDMLSCFNGIFSCSMQSLLGVSNDITLDFIVWCLKISINRSKIPFVLLQSCLEVLQLIRYLPKLTSNHNENLFCSSWSLLVWGCYYYLIIN